MTTKIRSMAGAAVAVAALLSAPAAAQTGISVEPYVAYGFYGTLPDGGPRLEADVAFGGRAAYQLAPQWAVFGNFQRSTPSVNGGADATVDHWSAGVEFSYAPRQGAEGILPILFEVGAGQTRYDFPTLVGENKVSDLTVNLGLASALRLTPNVAIRYGVNDYISNYRGDRGITNQFFARIGAELSF